MKMHLSGHALLLQFEDSLQEPLPELLATFWCARDALLSLTIDNPSYGGPHFSAWPLLYTLPDLASRIEWHEKRNRSKARAL